MERYFPLIIERYETLAASGGAGLHRGGNGIDMVYRFLEPGMIAIHDDRWFVHPWGVNGGAPGSRARKILVSTDGTETSSATSARTSRSRPATCCTSSTGVAAAGATPPNAIRS